VALTGTRAPGANWHKQAPRPWLDRMDITTKTRTRVMDSPADVYEEFVAALDADVQQFIVTRENRTTITDAWLRTAGTTDAKQLTKNVDVGPEVSQAQFKRFQVTRPRDGTKYWVEVTLPRDWKPGNKAAGHHLVLPARVQHAHAVRDVAAEREHQRLPHRPVGAPGQQHAAVGEPRLRVHPARHPHLR
jgi:hypothetical protein